ncbi:hypothetical protein BU17DRAFT_40458 [Hysterangium stoloniferum]|nr:hypothetical protein BU17DRAFT_40458 [Hysterangium stoloniferum]
MDAPSTQGGSDLPPDFSQTSSSTGQYGSDLPPDFNQASASSSTAPPPPSTPLVPPTNFLTIERVDHAIKGTYSIDPTMPCPPGIKPSVGADGKELHMRLASKNGSVDAVVEIIRAPDAKGPARLDVDSKNGAINVKYDGQQNHFRLRAASNNGSVRVHIPSTFIGTISTVMKNGGLHFSAAVQARLTTFSERNGEGRFFIGDYVESGYDTDETWLMDHLHIDAHNGNVKIKFNDEDDVGADSSKGKGGANGKGFFNRIFGS